MKDGMFYQTRTEGENQINIKTHGKKNFYIDCAIGQIKKLHPRLSEEQANL